MSQPVHVLLTDRTGHWSLFQLIPDFLAGNEVIPLDAQDLPNASRVEGVEFLLLVFYLFYMPRCAERWTRHWNYRTASWSSL